MATSEFAARSFSAAAAALGRISRASVSSKSTWRCKLLSSTRSRSMIRTRPTPARTSSVACMQPRPPQPTTTTVASIRARWPLAARPPNRTWREYLAGTMRSSCAWSTTPTPRLVAAAALSARAGPKPARATSASPIDRPSMLVQQMRWRREDRGERASFGRLAPSSAPAPAGRPASTEPAIARHSFDGLEWCPFSIQ